MSVDDHLNTLTDIEDLDKKIDQAVDFDRSYNHDYGDRIRQPVGETRLLLEILQLQAHLNDLYDEQRGE